MVKSNHFNESSTMKHFMYLMLCCWLLSQQLIVAADATWQIQAKDPAWARETQGFSVVMDPETTREGKPTIKVTHSATHDWAVKLPQIINVQPGDIFELSCFAKNHDLGSYASTGVTLRADKEVLSWVYGGKESHGNSNWTELKSQFIVPPNATSIEPRFTGSGPGIVWFDSYTIRKVGHRDLSITQGEFVLENSTIKVTFEAKGGSFSVLDKRIGRTWEQSNAFDNCCVIEAQKKSERQIDFCLMYCESGLEVNISLELEAALPELKVTLNADPQLPLMGRLEYPRPFKGVPGDRVILPVNEGISFPVEEKDPGVGYLITYGGHGLCMGFFGQIKDEIDPAKANGYLGIIETSDDAGVNLKRATVAEGVTTTLALYPSWEGQKQQFGYSRVLRYVFFDQGGHVALCKRYRQHAIQTGLYVPFSEKIKRNPNIAQGIDLLLGAANIWGMGCNAIDTVKEMKELGMDRILWSAGGGAETLTQLNEMDNVLTSRYDIYQDLMDPALVAETGSKKIHSDWTQDAWPHDVNWRSPDGTQRIGWAIDAPDKTKPRIPCVVLCDSKALPYAEKRIGEELKTKPFRARFLDTTVAAPWFECWNPDHPMTRSESREWKMKLLDMMGKQFNLVCGSETGHEASVPYCDFYEGMMSLGSYRVPDSGRYLTDIWDDVPEKVGKYQTGEAYRLPLWELVYHDCTVSYWYWGDYNNKLPKLWRKRDFFNALYGVPPMYLFTQRIWRENKEKFAASYQVAAPVSRLTGDSEMVDHRILSQDRTVQQTIFANGCKVTVNFGTTPFKLPDGTTLPADDFRIE